MSSVTLNTDIVAQTIGNLGVDLKATTIESLPIDIKSQSTGDILMNIDAQNIDRITVREHRGGVESSKHTGVTVNAGQWHTFVTANERGAVEWVMFDIPAATDSQKIFPALYIDDVLIEPVTSFLGLDAAGFNQSTRPIQLMKYSVDGYCVCMFHFPNGQLFDTKLEIKVFNSSATENILCVCYWFYRVIPG